MTTTRIVAMASHQLVEQFVTADAESVRPMAIMIGPVTTGGKHFMTFATPKALMNAASTKYKSPAKQTPTHAYGSSSAFSIVFPAASVIPYIHFTAAYPLKNAKEDPRNAGTFLFVIRWNRSVPRPANNSVVATSNPVRIGDSTVAPNIANMCCKPKSSVFPAPISLTL